MSLDKEYVHIINGQTSVILDVIEDMFGIQEVRKQIRDDFLLLKKYLHKYNIEYKFFRNVLSPYAKSYSYFFNADKLEMYGYFNTLNRKIIKCLDDNSNAIFLGGDLIYSHKQMFLIKKILEEASINTDEFLISNYCNIIIVGISDYASKIIDEMFTRNIDGYKGFYNVTNPTHLKEYFMEFACQFSIKLGKKLIFPSPDHEDKTCDYSGFFIKEDVDMQKKYKLVPVPEDLYSTFLTYRPQVSEVDIKELLISLNMFYDIDKIEYPSIFISDSKVNYINKHIMANFSKEELESEIMDSLKKNQISHMTYTNLNECKSIDFNIPYYLNEKIYVVGCKWNFDENVVEVITII